MFRCFQDDRLCLNCQLVEAGACECPCECPLYSDPCPTTASDTPPTLQSSSPFGNNNSESSWQPWQLYFNVSFGGGQPVPQVLELATQPPDSAPTCSRTPEPPVPLQYSIGLLAHLDSCIPTSCSTHMSYKSCLGVVGCVWCWMKSDGESLIAHPHCTQVHQCYGGILGGPSPYPHSLATLPHSDNTHGGSGSPIGPGEE